MSKAKDKSQYTLDPTGQKKVILSIDGGGMRGAITLAMLAELEKQSQKTCHQMFDMFSGTSTGAIIAAGLAMGYSAQYILDEVYKKRIPQAFDQKQGPWLNIFTGILGIIALISAFAFYVLNNSFLQALFGAIVMISGLLFILGLILTFTKNPTLMIFARLISNRFQYIYKLEPIAEALEELVKAKGVKTITDIEDKILLITTKDVTTGEVVYVVNKGEGARDDRLVGKFTLWPLAGAVAGSSAAPVFFPPVINRFVDGGVSPFNNPCFITAVEAMEYIGAAHGYEDGNVILVSVGTGYPPHERSTEQAEKMNVLDWIRYVITESIDDSVHQQVFLTRTIYGMKGGKRLDFRRYNPLLTKQNVTQNLNIAIPNGLDPQKLGLDSFDKTSLKLMENIGREYAKAIDWSQEHALPWDNKTGQPNPKKNTPEPVKWTPNWTD